jgi:hypothetical protein
MRITGHADDALGGRSYARVYRTSGKADVHAFLRDAVERSGGTVLFASPHTRAPVFLGVQAVEDERLGVLVYPFRATTVLTRNRPADETRLQVRYGSEGTWHSEEHPVGRDVAGVDVTVLLGVDIEAGVLIGLDPLRYDPLPMGISIELKTEQVERAAAVGWNVWERENRPGPVRDTRAAQGLETLIAFKPERLLDYVRLERQASALGLDPPLRFRAAAAAETPRGGAAGTRHALERDFELTSAEILDIITRQGRLAMAVRGGVAEHKLHRVLEAEQGVRQVEAVDRDGGDFLVTLDDSRKVLVECKNASPTLYRDGAFRVEVQKTRASKGDPASRYYRQAQFDIVAACLFSPTRHWDFRFQRTTSLRPHTDFAGRIAAMQRVDETWRPSLTELLAA